MSDQQNQILNKSYEAAKWLYHFAKQNFNDFISINGHNFAAAIAFYGFLSLFPLSIALITLFRVFIGIEGFEERLINGIIEQIPVLEETQQRIFIQDFIHNVSNNTTVTSGLTGLGLFVAGLGVFGSIRKSVNIIWGINRPRPFIVERAIDFVLMMGASTLLFLSVMLTAIVSFLGDITDFLFPGTPFGYPAFIQVLLIVVPPIVTYLVFIIIYWWLPNTKVRLIEIASVSLLAAAAFEIAKYMFILFIRYSGGSFTSVYGSISTIMVFFFFVYTEAIILLVGAMLSAKWANFLRIRAQHRQNEELMKNLRRINLMSHLPFVPLSDTPASTPRRP